MDVRLACAPRGVGMLLGLDTTMNLILAFPAYQEIIHLSPAKRAAAMRDSERRRRVLSKTPQRLSVPGSSVPPMEVVNDFLSEGDGGNSIYYPIFNYAPGDLSKVHDMLLHPKALPSLADGGVHVVTICDARCTTTMLAHWALKRAQGPGGRDVDETKHSIHGRSRPRCNSARLGGGPEPVGVGPLGGLGRPQLSAGRQVDQADAVQISST